MYKNEVLMKSFQLKITQLQLTKKNLTFEFSFKVLGLIANIESILTCKTHKKLRKEILV